MGAEDSREDDGDTGEEHEHKRVNEPRGNQVFINNNISFFSYNFRFIEVNRGS